MPKFSLDYKISHSAQEGYDKIKKVVDKGGDLKKFDPKIECTFDDAKKTCFVKGAQFKAEMAVKPDGDNSKVVINVDLPLLLMPFKGKVQESLEKMLKKHLG